jgi:hypothetical protein
VTSSEITTSAESTRALGTRHAFRSHAVPIRRACSTRDSSRKKATSTGEGNPARDPAVEATHAFVGLARTGTVVVRTEDTIAQSFQRS